MKDNNIDALKAVYVALGGSASDVANLNTNAEVIEKIAEVAGSTVELPAVSSSDNGKVLTVDGGKWKAKQPARPTSYMLTGDYNLTDPTPKLSISMPSGLTRSAMCTNGKALVDNTFIMFSLGVSGTNTTVFLPCTGCDNWGCVFSGIAVLHSGQTTSFKKITIFVSVETVLAPDAIKIEDFSFSE